MLKHSIKYRPDIDGMRAIAIILVLAFHFDLFAMNGGFIGVDVFFVISGYLITTIILKRLESNNFSFIEFYVRRVRRLAPAMTFVVLMVVVVSSFLLLPPDFNEMAIQAIATQFYVANIYFWQNINYFELQANEALFLHTWSLAVEEQFYLFFPVMLFILYKYIRKYFWHIILLCFVLSLLLNIILVEKNPTATFYLLPTRAWELLAGALAVRFSTLVKRDSHALGLSILGLAAVIASAYLYKSEYAFPGYFALFPVIGALFLIMAGNRQSFFTTTILSNPLLVYIGKISYSLYLVHWPLNYFASQYIFDEYDIIERFSVFVVSIVFSILIYHLIENPFRISLLSTNKKMISGYAVALVAIVFSSMLIIKSDGFSNRFEQKILALADYSQDKPPDVHCQYVHLHKTRLENKDFCHIGDPDVEPDLLIYGDSHVWAGQKAFDLWLRKHNKSAIFMFNYRCLPIKDTLHFKRNRNCLDYNASILNYVNNRKNIKNVFLVSLWGRPDEGLLINESGEKLYGENAINAFNTGLAATIDEYQRNNINVIIWEPLPGAKKNVPKELAKAYILKKNINQESIAFSFDEYTSKYTYFFEALSRIDGITKRFSPARYLCDEQNCIVVSDGKPVYFDDNHILYSSSKVWADRLSKELTTPTN